MQRPNAPKIVLEKVNKIKSKRAKKLVEHIINHGYVTISEFHSEYGFADGGRAAREARSEGIPLIAYKMSGPGGKTVVAYRFPDESEIENFKNIDIWNSNRIGSIRTFIGAIEKLNLDKPSKYSYFFRGHSHLVKYKLEPSIYRENRWIENEHRMFREVIIRCPEEFSSSMSTFEKLVKMQHYSLPTRLLDVTENPLVALYFACNSNFDANGEVLIFRIPKTEVKYYDSDTVSVISNISKRPVDFDITDIENLDIQNFNKHSSIKYLIHEIKEEKPYFEPSIKPKHLKSVVCVKPKLDNPRIIRQDGAFLLFGMNGKKREKATIPDDYLVTGESLRLVINKSEKEKLLKQLSLIGITDAKMFPEIDSVSNYLKSNFKKELTN